MIIEKIFVSENLKFLLKEFRSVTLCYKLVPQTPSSSAFVEDSFLISASSKEHRYQKLKLR